jgi:hypothetical protein
MSGYADLPWLAGRENSRFGKRLEGEIYVASEASATPLASYALQSNFSHRQRVSLPWTPGTEMLSSADFPLPTTLVPRLFATRRIATKPLISGGFSS